jgi:hypothetical protein
MITKELLWRIRNELPMKLTIQRLGNFGPIAKQCDGYFCDSPGLADTGGEP